jgi:hypothetical protein
MNNGWNLSTDVSIGGRKEVHLHHLPADGRGRFVARFKHSRPTQNARAFAKFLVANFTPAEYFAALESGKPPLAVLWAKGYVSPTERAVRRIEAANVARFGMEG